MENVALHITDFQAGTGGDVLDLSQWGGHTKLVQSGADTLVRMYQGSDQQSAVTVAVMEGVSAAKLTAANFVAGFTPEYRTYTTSVAENTNTVTTIAPTDSSLAAYTKYTLTGVDAKLFKISKTGVLSFATAKDYEQPTDANHDGIYEVSVKMTNLKTYESVTKNLTVGVEFAPIVGTAEADTLTGTTGRDTLDGMGGNDKLTGGTGLDTFLVNSGHSTITDFNLLTKGASGSEILKVSEGATADVTVSAAWTATADSYNDGTTTLFTSGKAVDLSAVSHGQGWNVSNLGVSTSITGSQFNDVLTGGRGNDRLSGGAGDDVLVGGGGSDVLTGGAGVNTFVLGGDYKTDVIVDFKHGVDHVKLDHVLYQSLSVGELDLSKLTFGSKAMTASDHLFYNQATGSLWYDVDGSGKAAAKLIAVFDNHTVLTYADLAVI